MRILSWFLRLIVFLLLFGLALNNLEPVTLHLLFGAQWRAPMIVLLLVVFALGAVLGVLALLPSWMRHRRQGRAARENEPLSGLPAATAKAPAEFPQHPIDRPIDGV
ncbi:MAG: LapA family protein [Thiomonas sp.]|uniref:LapA family protein n=1 Tax=Thiomonas sp. TaxID=2047785 RepID=UPI002A363D4D|nr:LapA family protein [Thiomonas sp.]MDY0328988.1 LapA family protein [Thiomonas sp.]